MNDVHFRRALAYAFDYDGFIKDILKGAVARNPGPNPNNLWGAPKDLKGFTYDLEKAKAELALVKEPLRPITIGTLAGFSETEQAATLLQNGAKKIGIDIKIESAPWPVIQSRMQDREKNYDMVPAVEEHLLRRPQQLGRRAVRLALHRHAQHLVHQGCRARQMDRRGAGDQRPGEAPRAVREGGDQGDRAGDGHLRLQHASGTAPMPPTSAASASARSAADRTCAGRITSKPFMIFRTASVPLAHDHERARGSRSGRVQRTVRCAV